MKVICSYCREKLGEKEPFEDENVSHGMCEECYDYYQEQIKGLSLEEYLDKFEAPVIIVDRDGRIVAANEMAETVTGRGKSTCDLMGLLGGEVMECMYARLPEGCGRTEHCVACGIRNTVMASMESGKSQVRVPVKLQKVDKEVRMVISTTRILSLVRIVIERELLSNPMYKQ